MIKLLQPNLIVHMLAAILVVAGVKMETWFAQSTDMSIV
jgi:hypothetical protein